MFVCDLIYYIIVQCCEVWCWSNQSTMTFLNLVHIHCYLWHQAKWLLRCYLCESD